MPVHAPCGYIDNSGNLEHLVVYTLLPGVLTGDVTVSSVILPARGAVWALVEVFYNYTGAAAGDTTAVTVGDVGGMESNDFVVIDDGTDSASVDGRCLVLLDSNFEFIYNLDGSALTAGQGNFVIDLIGYLYTLPGPG